MNNEELISKAKEFEKNNKTITIIENAWNKHKQFLKLFPFREHPEEIDLLMPEKLYNPGTQDYFFHWIEHKLKDVGHLRLGSALPWENAKDNIEKFKELLRIIVNEQLKISDKIDEHWEDIKGFGGDKTIPKKILFCYYPEKILPIFKTEDLEHFAEQLHIDFKKETYEIFGKSYEMLTVGHKFELLNKVLIDFKNRNDETKKWDNILFARFLYNLFPPQRIQITARTTNPLSPLGILFEPEYEQEVVYLFSLFHRELGFPYIIKIRNEYPDGIVMDKKKHIKKIEFEVRASDFISHKHDKKACDFIVCWENDLEENENLPQIIALKDFIEKLK